ncbi:cytochrome P450 [Actinoplanes regularis]|uniref:Cytochrome P450 n=1 Tax=Actinoplanes regularis TaxID=52697 RepID=A0A238W8Y1_9ACTN|nr:cytochrome P450 [Actinoplanes regularis]SNR43010.1 Cytochrome P450 [Actinoplanes regularis]
MTAHATSRMRRARRRDRRVYLFSHPVLFALLASTRRRTVRRLGGTVLAHSRAAFRDGLTRVPLDRTAAGTTGGAAGDLTGGDLLFNQDGDDHRGTRRTLAESMSADGVERLRPVWTTVLDRRLAPLAAGGRIDLVDVAAELAGATAAALLGLDVDARALAAAARAAAAAGAREHLPGLPRPGGRRTAEAATARLTALLTPPEPGRDPAMAAMLAVAAINTTVAALPRAAAWCADADLWAYAETAPDALTSELLRVTAPTPLLPRVAAAPGTVDGHPVHAGDRLILVARHAVDAHRTDPRPADPAPPQVAQLVFGAGPHACPGARLARRQLTDALRALAAFRPRVVTARVDRRSALPGWSRLILAPAR